MKVERYVGGKKLSLDQIKKYTVKNKTVDMVFERVVNRKPFRNIAAIRIDVNIDVFGLELFKLVYKRKSGLLASWRISPRADVAEDIEVSSVGIFILHQLKESLLLFHFAVFASFLYACFVYGLLYPQTRQ